MANLSTIHKDVYLNSHKHFCQLDYSQLLSLFSRFASYALHDINTALKMTSINRKKTQHTVLLFTLIHVTLTQKLENNILPISDPFK